MMKSAAFLSAILAAVFASDVVVKFSGSDLIQGSEEGEAQASVMSLARLTLESLAIPHSVLGAQPLPIVPDFIAHTDAFGILFVENYNAKWNVKKGDYAFEKKFTLEEESSGQFPALVNVLAEGAKQKDSKSQIVCSGKLCSTLDKENVGESIQADEEFVKKLDSFDLTVDADKEFVLEVAQLNALLKSVKNPSRAHHPKDIYVATISTFHKLTPEKQTIASTLIDSLAVEFQETLSNKYTKVGLQLIKVNGAMTVNIKALSAASAVARSLSAAGGVSLAATNGTLPTPLTIEQISEYQVILWSSVLLVLIIFVAVSMLTSIDASRDNLLYAKFLTDPSGRKND